MLRPWWWALGWLLLITIMATVVHAFQVEWRRELIGRYWTQKYFSASSNLPDVLVLGDSLVGSSFPPSGKQPKLFGEDYSWANLWLARGAYTDFYGLLSDIPLHAKVILVGQDSLVRNGIQADPRISIKLFLKTLVGYIQFGPSEKAIEIGFGLSKHHCKSRDESRVSEVVERLSEQYSASEPLSPDAILFLSSLKSIADRVVVVELPRAESLNHEVDDALISFRHRLSVQLQEEGVSFVTLGESLPENYYCDGSHPNELGKQVRTQQLVKLVQEILSSTR